MSNKLTIKDYVFDIVIAILFTSIIIAFDNYDQIKLSCYGDIEEDQVRPILTTGKLLEPVLMDKPWVMCYTIGYANSTNRFYIRYEFTYFFQPHRLQYTKWQEAPQELIAIDWDMIEEFAGSWLPKRAYPFDSEILTYGGVS